MTAWDAFDEDEFDGDFDDKVIDVAFTPAAAATTSAMKTQISGRTEETIDEAPDTGGPFNGVPLSLPAEAAQGEETVLETPEVGSTAANETIRALFPRLDWHALWRDDADADEDWILWPLLPARRLVAIYSAAKVGKSLLMLELAVCLSLGIAFLGTTPARRFRVLYVDHENDPRGDVRTRLQAMGYGPDDLDHLDYLSFPTMAVLDSKLGGDQLLAAVQAYGSEVVIIDTVSRVIDGEESSNDTWLNVYRHTGLKLKVAGRSMIRLDHSGKDEGRGQRGGSAKAGDVDAIWRLSSSYGNRFRLDCEATRMLLDTTHVEFTRETSPTLHHKLTAATAATAQDRRVAELVKVCDTAGLAPDANRDAVRNVAHEHDIKLSSEVLATAIRIRKGAGSKIGQPLDSTSPTASADTDRAATKSLV